MIKATIRSLNIYPVKSLAGIRLNYSEFTGNGLAHDRQWLVAKAGGKMLTQRQHPSMCQIQPKLVDDALVLSAAGMGEIRIAEEVDPSDTRSFSVWKDTCYGHIAHHEVNQWLGEALKLPFPVVLAQTAPNHLRQQHTPERFSTSFQGFADAAPYLVGNDASLEALNDKLRAEGKETVTMDRFRANIILDGVSPFAEHTFSQLEFTDFVAPSPKPYLELIDHCSRCIMITRDPQTGLASAGNQPFSELAQLNSMPGQPKAPTFGVNAVLRGEPGTIAVGDRVTLT